MTFLACFKATFENVAHLKQQYMLNETANEVIIVIEAYRTLRDKGPYPPDQVVKDIHGKFAFVLYDSASKSTFLADVDGSVPFFWGTDSEGHLVLSDNADIVKQGCGKLLKNDKSPTSVVNEMGGLLIRLGQSSFL